MSQLSLVHAQKKPLGSRNINISTNNQKDPVLSADGSFIIYLSDYSPTRDYQPFMSEGNGFERWEKPELVEKVFKTNLELINGYFLTNDGSKMLISSRRAKGIGGYDIWEVEKNGKYWGVPINFGKPLNTLGNEGGASLSPDEKEMYFMRCETMAPKKVDGCKILISEKKGSRWGEGQEISGAINEYNAAYPKILSDNQTLLFSSDRPGGKGGWDFYISKKENGTWSKPINVEIANTDSDNLAGSIPARGDVFFFSGQYKGKEQLLIAKLPPELQPKKVIMSEGIITDSNGQPIQAIVSAYDIDLGQEIYVGLNEEDGTFKTFLPEGHLYDLSFFPLNNDHSFKSFTYDFTTPETSKKENFEISLEPLSNGTQFELENLRFNIYSSDVSNQSEIEINRLKRLLQKNPSMEVELEVNAEKIFSDTIVSSPELTELIIDTVYNPIDLAVLDSIELDSIFHIEAFVFNEDSTQYLSEIDTTFYNDRTEKQALKLSEKLLLEGFPEEKFTVIGNSGPEGLPSDTVNYWVELKVLSY
ncbi:MAG: hypothetical protein AAF363_01480 [Bacteroidota bacterium]